MTSITSRPTPITPSHDQNTTPSARVGPSSSGVKSTMETVSERVGAADEGLDNPRGHGSAGLLPLQHHRETLSDSDADRGDRDSAAAAGEFVRGVPDDPAA